MPFLLCSAGEACEVSLWIAECRAKDVRDAAASSKSVHTGGRRQGAGGRRQRAGVRGQRTEGVKST